MSGGEREAEGVGAGEHEGVGVGRGGGEGGGASSASCASRGSFVPSGTEYRSSRRLKLASSMCATTVLTAQRLTPAVTLDRRQRSVRGRAATGSTLPSPSLHSPCLGKDRRRVARSSAARQHAGRPNQCRALRTVLFARNRSVRYPRSADLRDGVFRLALGTMYFRPGSRDK